MSLQTFCSDCCSASCSGVALALLRDQSDRRLHRAEDVSGAFDAPVVTTVPRHRKLKRHAPFEDLPPEVAEAFRMLQVNLRYGRDRAGAHRARDLLAQPRGQDDGRLEPGLGRGLERPLGRARGGRHAASRAGRALRPGSPRPGWPTCSAARSPSAPPCSPSPRFQRRGGNGRRRAAPGDRGRARRRMIPGPSPSRRPWSGCSRC